MRAIGNFFWFIFSGLWMGLAWWLAALFMYISIIGIPFGKACFTIGKFAFFPFGKVAIDREELTLQEDIGTSGYGTLGNIVWFLICGWWLALGHLLYAIGYFVSIIGFPFGVQHLKIAGIALSPIGKTIVSKEVAEEARSQNAKSKVAQMRGQAPAQSQEKASELHQPTDSQQQPQQQRLEARDTRELPAEEEKQLPSASTDSVDAEDVDAASRKPAGQPTQTSNPPKRDDHTTDQRKSNARRVGEEDTPDNRSSKNDASADDAPESDEWLGDEYWEREDERSK